MLPSPKNKILSEKITSLSSRSRIGKRRGSWRIANDLPSSFRYAAHGILYSCLSQRNFRVHLFMGALVFALAIWLKLSINHLGNFFPATSC